MSTEKLKMRVEDRINQELIEIICQNLAVDLEKIKIEALRIGVFYSGIKLNTGHAGIAFTPRQELPEAVCCPTTQRRMPDAGKLLDYPLTEILEYALDENGLKSCLGVATINALSNLIMEKWKDRYKVERGVDALDLVNIKDEDNVAMIGYFPPFVRKIKDVAKNLWVMERNPRANKGDLVEALPAEAYEEIVPQAQVLIITGVTLVNHTLEGILEKAKLAREIVVVGPTASMIPDPLFKRGVTILGGIRVHSPDLMLRLIEQGGSGYDFFESCADKIAIRRD